MTSQDPPTSDDRPPGLAPGGSVVEPTDPDDDSDLAGSLAGLAGLTAQGSTLKAMLTQIAGFATQAIPGADGAGLTLLEPGRSDLIVKSELFVVEVDDIQYSLGEGPCIDAAAQGRTMRSGSLSEDARYPRFGPRVGRLGVHSVLSLPLITLSGVVGALNVYAHARDAFDEQAERIGELFAAPAAISVQNAQILAQAERLATQLQAALDSRAIVDQAIGILRYRSGLTAGEALTRLRQMSQHEQRKLPEVASALVADAVNQARRRTASPEPPSR